ncbi:hypothetical protein [Botrimarina sp.]|uniref:hypothetical protein n=1 Tax=Botrimarina sp. TaxID=2795802 RepID=UPI0032ED91F0
MSETETPSTEYEFSEEQNRTIGGLALKMSMVGMLLLLFGLLQMVNGVSALVMSRNPDRMLEAAEKAGIAAEQMDALKIALEGGSWSSPLAVSAIGMAIGGLLLLLFGVWTRQAAWGFAGIVRTEGKDVSRLMGALGALHLKYGTMYYLILTAAIISLVSLLVSWWQASQ